MKIRVRLILPVLLFMCSTKMYSQQIEGSNSFTLYLCSDSTVWSWGSNLQGQLGNGTTEDSYIPTQVIGLNSIVSISAGGESNMALKSDGTVWTWGFNYNGELGDGTVNQDSIPKMVEGLDDITKISAGTSHSMALTINGTVYTWGSNYDGQLGNGTTIQSLVPIEVPDLNNVIAIEGGTSRSMVLKSDSTVWMWGNNFAGELGDNTTIDRLSPVQTVGLTGVTEISAGVHYSLVIKSDSTVWGWGRNPIGELGNGTVSTIDSIPVQALIDQVVEVDAGYHHSQAIKADGTIWSWGQNDGQFGDGELAHNPLPVQTLEITDATWISSSSGWSSFALEDDQIWVWGLNNYGQLGIGEMDYAPYELEPFNLDFDCTVDLLHVTQNETNAYSLYPNPLNESATLQFQNPSNELHSFALFDIAGKKVLEINQITNNSIFLERGELEAGVYVFQLIKENNLVISEKLIISD